MQSLDRGTIEYLSKFCSVAQTFSYAGRADVVRTVHGEAPDAALNPGASNRRIRTKVRVSISLSGFRNRCVG